MPRRPRASSKTVQGHITRSIRRGSTRWDTKFLEGYVLNHPELLKYKLEGKPTVAFKLKDEIPFENE